MNKHNAAEKRSARTLPAEGEDGLYSQTWFPVCLSADLGETDIVGRALMGGRVIAFRDSNGDANVTSAFCAHLGVDLQCATLVDGLVRCPYHHFHYDGTGRVVHNGVTIHEDIELVLRTMNANHFNFIVFERRL